MELITAIFVIGSRPAGGLLRLPHLPAAPAAVGIRGGLRGGGQCRGRDPRTGFMRDVLGIVVGIVVGILFAGRLPVVVGRRRVRDRGNGVRPGLRDPSGVGIDIGLVNLLVGLAVAVAFAIVAVVLRLPRMIIVAITALWGGSGRRRRAPAAGPGRARRSRLRRRRCACASPRCGRSSGWRSQSIVVQIVTTEEVRCCRPGRAPPSCRASPDPRVPGTY